MSEGNGKDEAVAAERERFLRLRKKAGVRAVTVDGETFHVRMVLLPERGRIDEETSVGEGKARRFDASRARTVILRHCLSTPEGAPVFTEKDDGLIAALPAAVVEPVFEAAMDLNKLRSSDVEVLEKNSEPTPSDSSSTG